VLSPRRPNPLLGCRDFGSPNALLSLGLLARRAPPRVPDLIAPAARQDSRDQRDSPDSTDPILKNEPTESAEPKEPADPIDRIDPDDPIDKIDPDDPIDKIEPDDPMDRIESEVERLCDPASDPMPALSQPSRSRTSRGPRCFRVC
jgi:hypothetical protein